MRSDERTSIRIQLFNGPENSFDLYGDIGGMVSGVIGNGLERGALCLKLCSKTKQDRCHCVMILHRLPARVIYARRTTKLSPSTRKHAHQCRLAHPPKWLGRRDPRR